MRKIRIGVMVLVLNLIAGCSEFKTPDVMIQPPKNVLAEINKESIEGIAKRFMPKEYKLAKQMIETEKIQEEKLLPNTEIEFKGSVISKDLNCDGMKEILFMIQSEKDFYNGGIIILQKINGVWKKILEEKGEGERIYRINFKDIDADGRADILVSKFIGASAGQSLEIFSFKDKLEKLNVELEYNMMEVWDMPNEKGEKDKKQEIAIWLKNTGNIYDVNVYRYDGFGGMVFASDAYPYYFKKVANYYKNLVCKEKDDYWAYYYLADSEEKIGYYNDAMNNLNIAYSIIKNEKESNIGIPRYEFEKMRGLIYKGMRNYTKAENCLKDALNILKNSQDYIRVYGNKKYKNYECAYIFCDLAKVYIEEKNYNLSRKYCAKGLEIIKTNDKSEYTRNDNYANIKEMEFIMASSSIFGGK